MSLREVKPITLRLRPGDSFQGYEILRQIGEGGLGQVFEARHRHMGRRVALKLMRSRHVLTAQSRSRMAREAKVLSSFDHPNIVRIYDAGLVDDASFIVMELLEGFTLRQWFEEQRSLPIAGALKFFADWSSALEVVHRAGIVHRDLKPENLFVTTSAEAKLLDFGAVLDPRDRITAEGTTIGTPAYMSPEHIEGELELDGRSDIYELGVMLYEAIAGHHPFIYGTDLAHPHNEEFLRRHLEDAWPDPGIELPPVVPEILEKTLAKDRRDRFASMAELRDALRTAHRCLDTWTARPATARPAPARANRGTIKMTRQVSGEIPLIGRGGTVRMSVVPATPERLAPVIPLPRPPAPAHEEDEPTRQRAAAPRRALAWPIAIAVGVTGFALLGAAVFAVARGGAPARAASSAPLPPPTTTAAAPALAPVPAPPPEPTATASAAAPATATPAPPPALPPRAARPVSKPTAAPAASGPELLERRPIFESQEPAR